MFIYCQVTTDFSKVVVDFIPKNKERSRETVIWETFPFCLYSTLKKVVFWKMGF